MTSKGKQTDARRKDDQFDMEQHFILRLPPGQSMALAHELENGNNLKDNLHIDIQPDNRWGTVRYGSEVINAKLVDLPCIIETLKTTDNKTFYKTADISQMLICSNDMEPGDEEAESPKKKKEKEKKYQFLHGITPPLKNVRRRRFRKTLRKKPIDLASIEKEVKRLLRTDLEAIEVSYEEIIDDSVPAGDASGVNETGASGEVPLDEEKLFGEISSSEDEGEVNVEGDSDNEQTMAASTAQSAAAGSDPDTPAADAQNAEEDEDDDVILEKVRTLKKQQSALETRISQQEIEIKQMQNPDLRRRFEAVLDDLMAEKLEVTREIDRLENLR
ncbi:Taf7 [Bugula neritina]|uniref:Taf7 n=1 Tax=Bugula neritina TaxID=10212 RepID=A0A7J7KBV6_BUGNE|nr:Taf7 [Bugula neritina]